MQGGWKVPPEFGELIISVREENDIFHFRRTWWQRVRQRALAVLHTARSLPKTIHLEAWWQWSRVSRCLIGSKRRAIADKLMDEKRDSLDRAIAKMMAKDAEQAEVSE